MDQKEQSSLGWIMIPYIQIPGFICHRIGGSIHGMAIPTGLSPRGCLTEGCPGQESTGYRDVRHPDQPFNDRKPWHLLKHVKY